MDGFMDLPLFETQVISQHFVGLELCSVPGHQQDCGFMRHPGPHGKLTEIQVVRRLLRTSFTKLELLMIPLSKF